MHRHNQRGLVVFCIDYTDGPLNGLKEQTECIFNDYLFHTASFLASLIQGGHHAGLKF